MLARVYTPSSPVRQREREREREREKEGVSEIRGERVKEREVEKERCRICP